MKIENTIIGGVKTKLAPLISFDTIVDYDFGLINYIFLHYNDKNVFNQEFFKKDTRSIIRELYKRKDRNPLYTIANPGQDKLKLDSFYNEFLDKEIENIYDVSITTDMISLISAFNSSSEIKPTILCYNQKQMNSLINEDDLFENKKVLITDLSEKDKNEYTQFFFKDIKESEAFSKLKFKTFYVSKYGPNLSYDNDNKNVFSDEDLISKLIKNRNQIGIFDYYKDNILKERNNN